MRTPEEWRIERIARRNRHAETVKSDASTEEVAEGFATIDRELISDIQREVIEECAKRCEKMESPGEKPMNEATFEPPKRLSLRQTLLRGKWSRRTSNQSGSYNDTLYINSTIHLSFLDAIRCAFGATIHLFPVPRRRGK